MTTLIHPSRLNPPVTVGALPDDVLLKVDEENDDDGLRQDRWVTLVHVCRRWRCVVFASPRSLGLRLY